MLGILVSGLVSGFLNVAAAQQLSELTQKAALQAALAQFLSEAGSADGSFAVLNRKTASFDRLYPATLHPEIIPIKTGYYLCITMLNAKGQKIDADFLLRPKSGVANPQHADDFIVVDVIISNRALLRQYLSEHGAE